MTVTSGYSQYLENAQLNWLRGNAFPVAPSTLYFALFTTPPVNGVDSAAVEVVGTSYVRKAIGALATAFGAPSGAAPATSVLGVNVVWATPGGSWGTVTGWGVYDAPAGGNLLTYGVFTATPVGAGDTVNFLSGNLSVTAQ
jgi:hypothetical protein